MSELYADEPYAEIIERFVRYEEQFAHVEAEDAVRIYVLRTGERDLVRRVSRRLLAAALNVSVDTIELEYTEHGKPLLVNDPTLHFSTSHTENVALIGITRISPIGVDVEQMREVRNLEKILRRFFSEDDARGVLESDDVPHAFTRAWTRGEASVKVHGHRVWDMAREYPGITVRNLDLDIDAGSSLAAAVALATVNDDWSCRVIS